MFDKYSFGGLLLAITFLSGCSVYKAASNEGVSVADVRKCQTRGCFLSRGMEIINSNEESNGRYTETYRAQARKSGLNYVRAAGHGVLDVMTIGIWEAVGTPVEGALSNNRGYITVIANYPSKKADEFEKMDIYDANGKKIVPK
ncbi:MAG: hypothetical protein KBD23_06170 [Gammaproteobacteria bacterium]|nr:hypothetical protein [Gammaproteobacteria bacterium]